MCFTKDKLDVLFLEDLSKDVEIVHQKILDEFDCPVNLDSVYTAQSYLSYIANKKYDVILADYTLPGYNAEEALKRAQAICPDVPFICVSGTIGEDKAVELLKQGAADYVLKDRLGRLSFAIKRAIEAGEEKRNHKRMEESLYDSQHLAHIGSWDRDIIHNEVYWSDECYRIFGLEPRSIKPKGDTFLGYVHPEDKEKVSEAVKSALDNGTPYKILFRIVRPDGHIRHVYTKARTELENGKPVRLYGTVQDITKRKLDEDKTRQHIEFERTVLSFAQEFINIPLERLDDAFNKSMQMVGNYCGVDRSSIYKYDYEKEVVHRLYGWDKELELNRPIGEQWDILPFTAIPDIIDCHKKGNAHFVETFSDVPEDSQYLTTIKQRNSCSTANFPLIIHDKVWGTLGFSTIKDKKSWSDIEISTIQVFTEMLSNVILRIERERALLDANETNRFMLDSTHEGYGLYGRDGTILSISTEFARRFRKTPEECIGTSMLDYLPEEKYGDLGKKRMQMITQVFDSGEPAVLEDARDSLCYSNRFYPVYRDGRVTAVSIFSADITEQKRMEVETKRYAEFERLMMESTSDGIVMMDRDGNILNLNENFARRFGASKDTTIGKHISELLKRDKYPELLQERAQKLRMAFDSGENMTFEDERDGIFFLNRYHPVFKDGRVTAVTLFSTDITDRKRAEEEARAKAETEARLKVTTELFTNVSHEFKTPLSVILIQLELMKLYMDDEKKMNELIDAATQNSYRLNRLVGNLLDITKIDSGFMRANMTQADIVATIREICESVTDYAKARSIQLSFASETITKPMPMDMDKIERMILNLLSNAIKHTQPEGRIDVIFEDKGDAILICVEDTGEGIPIEKQAVIFDRFAQVDTSLTRKNEGSGIGLALVQSFVKLLGGRIWVESEEGRGSSFFIELPVPQENQMGLAIEMDGYSLKRKVEMELSDLYI